MILGVTGSRKAPKPELVEKLRKFISENNVTQLHHGDCVGWDEACHTVAVSMGVQVAIHPPNQSKFRAWCSGGVLLLEKPYLDRNKDIVNSVDYLIAAPDGPERQRSGTWSTVRYAKKVGVKGVVWI